MKNNNQSTSKKTISICLNMIVKNEAHIITETFDNLLKYIPLTYWVISDTGSTDGTQQIIKDYFKSKNIDGYEMYPHNFQKFIDALNQLFQIKIEIEYEENEQ